jgi:hypothetical protein
VLNGGDPLAERRNRRPAPRAATVKEMTFRECAEGYIADHENGWRNPKHRAQWSSTLARYVYPEFGAMPVNQVKRVIGPCERRKPKRLLVFSAASK